ncbi:ROK family transcriptional regulator [Flavimaricola marinus]|uniref:N-acetylglucosamine repressor n=1 Tax=Flavimaricola marinus TaxID=1819565 RepID=A0A238LIN7_9RHOB|nr:ROK family transcriptional regulator [Flavimaricola marinus]SMY09549.1 N-acetylglucosamine repressor [Flavimaricola marinus]
MEGVMRPQEPQGLSGGVNQHGVRDYNERLILSTIQRLGPHAGSEIARMTGLSPQTVSVILRALEQDGLLERGTPQRGRVGKPSVPMGLSPEGVFAFGLKIGRRSADLVLTDFFGIVRHQLQVTYRYPMPMDLLDFLRSGIAAITAKMPSKQRSRIAGIGIAQPHEIWNWHETIGAPSEELASWREVDFVDQISRFSSLPVFIENDATAACRAEHIYGRGREFRDFAYFFVGSFIGGGVVLNHSIFDGAQGNAGAFGSLPARRPDGSIGQLLDTASLYLLEAAIVEAGMEPSRLWTQPQDWSGFPELLDAWIDRAAVELAHAALTVCSVIDFGAVLIDGAFPEVVRSRLIEGVESELATLDSRGLVLPVIGAGRVGGNARAIGAACGPVVSQYLLNTHSGFSGG